MAYRQGQHHRIICHGLATVAGRCFAVSPPDFCGGGGPNDLSQSSSSLVNRRLHRVLAQN